MADPGTPATDVLDAGQAGSRAIRGAAVRLLTFGTATLCSVGSSSVLYRHLGVIRTGHYVTVTSLVTLCVGLTDAGLSAIGVRELANRSGRQRGELMRDLSGLRLALALLGVGVAISFAAVAGYGQLLVIGTAIAGVAGVLLILEDTWAIPLAAQLRVAAVAVADLVRVFLVAVGLVVCSITGTGLLVFFAVSVPAAGCAAFINARLIRREVPLLPRLNPPVAVALLRETLTYSLATAVMAVYLRLAVILVSVISTPTQTGYFSASARVIEVLLTVPVLLVGIVFPIFARAAQEDRARHDLAIGRVFDTLWLLGLGMALALFIGAPFIIGVIAGPRFHGSVDVLRIQGLAMIASAVGSVWSYTLLSLHRHREILVVGLVALLLSGGLSGGLAAVSGARGAALGATVAETLSVVMLGVATYRSGVRPAISVAAIPRSLLAAAVALAPLALSGVPDVAKLTLSLMLYVAALLMLRVVPPEILEQVHHLRRAVRR